MAEDKFNPLLHGFVKDGEAKDGIYQGFILIKDRKIIGELYHVNYFQGLPIEYSIKKVVHCFGGDNKSHTIFDGRIPTNQFGAELIKNLFY